MNNLLEQLVKVQFATKAAVAAVVVGALVGGNYFLFIDDLYTAIDAHQQKKLELEKELINKRVMADSLNTYRREREVLDRQLKEALTEMPTRADITDFVTEYIGWGVSLSQPSA